VLKRRAQLSDLHKGQRRWRRWRYRLAAATVALLLIGCFRVQILVALAFPLILEDRRDFAGPVVLLHQSKPDYDEAAELYRAKVATQILIVKRVPTRSEQLGIYGSAEQTDKELETRGIPEPFQETILCHDRRAWTFARVLAKWLMEHPGDRLTLVCKRFESRRARFILNRVLALEDRDRVQVCALADPVFDEGNWWKRKEGQLDVFANYLALLYSYVNGDSGPSGPDLTPLAYVRLADSGQ